MLLGLSVHLICHCSIFHLPQGMRPVFVLHGYPIPFTRLIDYNRT